MFPNLHLLVELDCWWSGAEPTETLVRLKTFLGAHRNITLTLASSTPLMACLETLATRGDGKLPDRVIAEGGLAIFHARDDGSWAEDTDYHQWVGTQWDPLTLQQFVVSRPSRHFRGIQGTGWPRRAIFTFGRDQPLREAVEELEGYIEQTPYLARVVVDGDLLEVVPKVIGYQAAAAHLHRHFASATPLMACARTEPFLEVLQLADYPVFLAGGELGHSTPDLPRSEGNLSPSMPSNGILDALLRLQSEPRLLQL